MTDANTELVENSHELIFLYDTVYTNPNGNPLTEENRPRIDTKTDEALVTAVRMKRVIRDYLDRQGHTIFIKKADTDGSRQDKGDRYEVLKEEADTLQEEDGLDARTAFLEVATDTRLFGDSMASKAFDFDASSITGPVQFDIARSMNQVDQTTMGKTSVITSDSEEKGSGGNMYNDHRIPYALIPFHGVIDAARAEESLMKETDIDLVLNGLWNGTREVTNTTSKRGHEPRLLIDVEYEGNAHIGDLQNDINLELADDVPEEKAIRDISDVYLNVTALIEVLADNQDKVKSVTIQSHRRTQFRVNGDEGGSDRLEELLENTLDEVDVSVTHE